MIANRSGGHGQDAIDFMDKNGIEYNIVKTYKNGVRVGNVPNHWKDNSKRKGIGQSWFPKSWGQKDVVKAAEHVLGLSIILTQVMVRNFMANTKAFGLLS